MNLWKLINSEAKVKHDVYEITKTDICWTEGFNIHTGNTFSKWNVLFLSAQKHILYLKIIEIDRTSEKDISIRTVKISIDLANDTSTS